MTLILMIYTDQCWYVISVFCFVIYGWNAQIISQRFLCSFGGYQRELFSFLLKSAEF